MKLAVRIGLFAEWDLEQIGNYIAADNPTRAVTFVAELRKTSAAIGQFPQAWPSRDDIRPCLRAASHGRYLILYSQNEGHVLVERIVRGSRNLNRVTQ